MGCVGSDAQPGRRAALPVKVSTQTLVPKEVYVKKAFLMFLIS